MYIAQFQKSEVRDQGGNSGILEWWNEGMVE
jgi:hypothetical protein